MNIPRKKLPVRAPPYQLLFRIGNCAGPFLLHKIKETKSMKIKKRITAFVMAAVLSVPALLSPI